MVTEDLRCQACGEELIQATATFDEFVEGLARRCEVDHHPQASVVHLAVQYALEGSLVIDPSKMFKMLYTDARLICSHRSCGSGNQNPEVKASQAKNVLKLLVSE